MPAAVEAPIPAWRKLGLKLKNTQEQAAITPYNAPTSPVKRKPQDDIERNPVKKAKKVAAPGNQTAQNATVQSSATPRKPALRKSVSFAAEAKTKDGESAKDLYNSWITSQKSSDPSFDPSFYNQDALKAVTVASIDVTDPAPSRISTDPTIKDSQPPSPPKKKKKKKKRNKSKSTSLVDSKSTFSSTTKPNIRTTTKTSLFDQPTTHPALIYLTTHHTSPTHWKFSKSRSSYLLRHLFSLAHIPASYTPALESYLQGLRSQNALQSIRQRAQDIRKEDEEWLDDSKNFQGWELHLNLPEEEEAAEKGAEGEEGEKGSGEVIKMDDPIKRKEVYLQALNQHKTMLRAREDAKQEAEKDRIWAMKVTRRKRVEGVLKVLNEHVYGNANGPPQDIKSPYDKPSTATGASVKNGITNGNGNGNAKGAANGTKQQTGKGKRKRKRRTTGVPDDDSTSSSSSSSSSSSESEPHDDTERMSKRAKRIKLLDAKIKALKAEGSSEEGSSDSGSDDDDTSSSGSGSE
ncbi:MAG: hypothetical protein Q9209_000559 [Squamulea sp. 1 TL-2023]